MSWDNAYNEGYNDGYNAAIAGQSINYHNIPFFRALISNNAQETYIEGYNEGYRIGKRDQKR